MLGNVKELHYGLGLFDEFLVNTDGLLRILLAHFKVMLCVWIYRYYMEERAKYILHAIIYLKCS